MDNLDRLPGRRRYRNVTPEMQDNAKRLRAVMTEAEQVLWDALREKKLNGLRFRRQHALGTFVLDFYCPAHKLVVEVDGAVHTRPDVAEHDALRDENLRAHGCRVVRFSNNEILHDLPTVLTRILDATNENPNKP